MLAGLCSSVIRVPTEVIKSRLQTGQFSNAFVAVSRGSPCTRTIRHAESHTLPHQYGHHML